VLLETKQSRQGHDDRSFLLAAPLLGDKEHHNGSFDATGELMILASAAAHSPLVASVLSRPMLRTGDNDGTWRR